MPREDVDRAAFPEFGICDLDLDVPAQGSETIRYESNDRRMSLVDEPVERGTAPPDVDCNQPIEGRNNPPDDADRDPVKMSALDQRDEILRAAGLCGEVRLSPALPLAESADRTADTLIVHCRHHPNRQFTLT